MPAKTSTSDKTTRTPNRRDIIRGAGVAAAAGVAAGVAGAPGARAMEDGHKWDRETDIICVGGGAASLTAAVVAAGAGKDVTVLEKQPLIGGTTYKSGSVFWIPNHFLLKEAGVEDKKDDCLKYMCKYAFPEFYDADGDTLGIDPRAYRLLEAFYDNGSVMVDHIRELGAMDVTAFRMWDYDKNPLDYQSHMPENKTPQGRPLIPKRADGTGGRGPDQIEQYEAYLTGKGVPILTDHRVTEVIKKDGAVVGVTAETPDGPVSIRARQAVIFGTGGYAHNEELIRLYQSPFHFGACAAAGATGDFVGIGESAGAKLGNMASGWRGNVVFEEAVANRVLGTDTFVQPGDSYFVVNKYGKRICNEKRNYNDRTRIHQVFDPNTGDYPNMLTFYIYDRRVAEGWAGQYPVPDKDPNGPYVISGDTLEDLTANIAARLKKYKTEAGGVTLASDFADQLKATFDRFNGFAETGKDLDFERGDFDYDRQWTHFFSTMRTDTKWKPNEYPNTTMHPMQEEGPYYCIILAAGFLDTNGGPVVNEKAQVVDPQDNPIPGLYGAGNCIASPSRSAYYGAGGTIGLAMTYGYIAAMNAMKEPVRSA